MSMFCDTTYKECLNIFFINYWYYSMLPLELVISWNTSTWAKGSSFPSIRKCDGCSDAVDGHRENMQGKICFKRLCSECLFYDFNFAVNFCRDFSL